MAIFVRHEPCPGCGSRDNLARYDDGSAHCFGGCGHWEPPTSLSFLKPKENENVSQLQLDDDLCFDFPRHVVEWLGRYGISPAEAIKHGWKYGPKRDQLVFVFTDEAGTPVVTQARNFYLGSKRKYFNQGSVEDILPIFRSDDRRGDSSNGGSEEAGREKRLVVVEDVVSAAKIARHRDAMPLLGSHLSKRKMSALRLLGYEQMVFWLDENKWREACVMADQAKLIGFDTRVVYTTLDPKEYSDEEISQTLQV